MKNLFDRLNRRLYIFFLKTPFMSRFSNIWYSKLGVSGRKFRIHPSVKLIGDFKFLKLHNNAEINAECFLLAKDNISIGENSTLAYRVTVLTSANPNGPHNKLVNIYPSIKAPVSIGKNTWIGAGSIILPGVVIGDFCVIAAGSLVNKNIPNYTVAAGVPAKPIKKLDPQALK